MKVLGTTGDGYVCEISHTEIEKFLNLYYGKKAHLNIGEVIDLGKSYDFASEIRSSLKLTREFINSNKTIIKAIIEGLSVVNENKNIQE